MTPSQPPEQPSSEARQPADSCSLEARILGPARLAAGGQSLPLEIWPRRTARSLLLLLLVTPGHRITRQRAVDLLWPDQSNDQVRHTWYQAVSTLRRVLEPDLPPRLASSFLKVETAAIALASQLDLWIDLDAFEQALRRAGASAADEQRAALRAALALYGGDLLAEEAADWATNRREDVRLAWQGAVLQLADLDVRAGEPLASLTALQAVLAADRAAEDAHRALIRAFVAAGERDQALRQYERCRHALWDDLGVEPGEATRELVAALSAGARRDPSPQRTAAPPPRPPPTPMTPLVGRDREIEVVEDLVSTPDVRLVTLTGPGGVGKTRLAIAVAHRFADEGANVVFVPLAGVRESNLVLFTVGQALGVRTEDAGSYLSTVLRRLGAHELLLVLDNFEHVAAAASLVAHLLAACSRLTMLVTSRTPLHLGGEHLVTVPPLALPGARSPSFAALARSEAVTLFAQRAAAVQDDFALTEQNAATIARLCARLDGLPLAIELAAARVRMLSPQAMLARLEQRLDLLAGGPGDAPARLRTMRDAIGWSEDLLAESERVVFRRLSVFAGGAALAAARWVTADGADAASFDADSFPPLAIEAPLAVPDALAALIEHSLVRQEAQADGEPRFAMLETIRVYARGRLQASGEADAIQRRHASWVIACAEAVLPCLKRLPQAAELERLAAEIDNVRAALSWTLAHGEGEMALRLATATFSLWYVRAMPGEGRRWLEDALAAAPDAPGVLRTDALLCASMLAFLQDDRARLVALAEEGLAVARGCGYPFGVAVASYQLGVAAEWRRDLDEAAARYDEVLGMVRQLDEPYWIALLLSNLGEISLARGRLADAATLANEGLARWRAMGNDRGVAQGLGAVATIARQQGDHAGAARLYEESLTPWVTFDDPRGIAGTLAGLAGLAGSGGLWRQAARLLGAAQTLGAGDGVRNLVLQFEYERVVSATRAHLADQVLADEWAAGQVLPLAQAIAEARAVAATVTMRAASPTATDETTAASGAITADADDSDETMAQGNVIPLRPRSRRPRRA